MLFSVSICFFWRVDLVIFVFCIAFLLLGRFVGFWSFGLFPCSFGCFLLCRWCVHLFFVFSFWFYLSSCFCCMLFVLLSGRGSRSVAYYLCAGVLRDGLVLGMVSFSLGSVIGIDHEKLASIGFDFRIFVPLECYGVFR